MTHDQVVAKALRILSQRMETGDMLTSSALTRNYLQLKLAPYEREVFAVLYLNNQHQLIKYEELFFGTIDGSMVHPREVVKAALKYNAAAVIFCHNHPSGVAEPSQADINITRRLKNACELVEIRVLDHLVVGSGEVTSLAERGLV